MKIKTIICTIVIFIAMVHHTQSGQNSDLASKNMESLLLKGLCNTCYLQKVNFQGADLKNASAQNSDLSYADFSNADLTGANFSGSNLRYASFNKTVLTNANFSGADLSHADLTGAELTNVNFSFTNLFQIKADLKLLKTTNHENAKFNPGSIPPPNVEKKP